MILGKANLTEFANILAIDMPSGYSSLGGQVRNPYVPKLVDKRGIPVVLPGGSSARFRRRRRRRPVRGGGRHRDLGFAAQPATQNGLVTVKPTVGLVGRAGILPISHSQDTAGSLTRTVRDAAILLNVLAARDPSIPRRAPMKRPKDYTSHLDKDGLEGRAHRRAERSRRSVERHPYFGKLTPRAKAVMKKALAVLEDLRRHPGAGQHPDRGVGRRGRARP